MGSKASRPELPEHWEALDQLNADMAVIREALEDCKLPFFTFTAEAIGGRPFVRCGITGHNGLAGPLIIWGKPWMISGRIAPFDVARVAFERARDLLLREAGNHFTFEGRHVFRKGD